MLSKDLPCISSVSELQKQGCVVSLLKADKANMRQNTAAAHNNKIVPYQFSVNLVILKKKASFNSL